MLTAAQHMCARVTSIPHHHQPKPRDAERPSHPPTPSLCVCEAASRTHILDIDSHCVLTTWFAHIAAYPTKPCLSAAARGGIQSAREPWVGDALAEAAYTQVYPVLSTLMFRS